MICTRCLRRASALRPYSSIVRTFASTPHQLRPDVTSSPPTPGSLAATSKGIAQPFSNPLSLPPSSVSQGTGLKSNTKSAVLAVSSCPAGTPLKGLNFLKGRDDPVALAEEEYPEWLWHCLDAKVKEDGDEDGVGDEFSKSKKLRRKAAKRQRKLEAKLLASGDTEALAPKIPITRQSIDLPANEEGSVQGALEAESKREEIRKAMRKERRSGIKERNFLGSM